MILKTYCGYLKDIEALKKSASGGLATAISEEIVKRGGVVYGVSYTKDFKSAEYSRVDTLDGLEQLKGSKYIKAKLSLDILEKVCDDTKKGKTVLFVGLPCDVNILRKYMEKHTCDYKNVFCVDLICHGPTYSEVSEQYIERLEKKFNSKLKKFSVRYKNPYWKPSYLYAEFENGNKYTEKFYDTDYGIAFSMMSRKSCYNCIFKGENYKSDITIGDCWGSKEGDVGYNKFGTSVAFVHTEKGDEFIRSLSNFNLYETDCEKVLSGNKRYLTSTEKTTQKEKFEKNFREKGLKYSVSKHLTTKQKIKRYAKRIISFVKK